MSILSGFLSVFGFGRFNKEDQPNPEIEKAKEFLAKSKKSWWVKPTEAVLNDPEWFTEVLAIQLRTEAEWTDEFVETDMHKQFGYHTRQSMLALYQELLTSNKLSDYENLRFFHRFSAVVASGLYYGFEVPAPFMQVAKAQTFPIDYARCLMTHRQMDCGSYISLQANIIHEKFIERTLQHVDHITVTMSLIEEYKENFFSAFQLCFKDNVKSPSFFHFKNVLAQNPRFRRKDPADDHLIQVVASYVAARCEFPIDATLVTPNNISQYAIWLKLTNQSAPKPGAILVQDNPEPIATTKSTKPTLTVIK